MKNYNDFIFNKTLEDLTSKFPKSVLSKKDLASELGVSVSTINNYIGKGGESLPRSIKLGTGLNGKVLYPVMNVVDYLCERVRVS